MRCEWGGWFLTWCGFLFRCFFMRVAFIIISNYKILCVNKYNSPMVYSEIPFGRDSFADGDRSLAKQCGSIYWFLYVAPLQKVFQITDKNNLLITHNDSVNTLQFFFTYPSTTWVESDEKICILHFIISVFVFFVLLFLICLTKFESIELKSYITILLFTIAVNMPFLEFSSRKGFSFNYTINAG